MKPTNVADGRGCWLSVLPELYFTYHRSFTAPQASSQTTRACNKVRWWRSCLCPRRTLQFVVNAAGDLSDETRDLLLCVGQLLISPIFIYFVSRAHQMTFYPNDSDMAIPLHPQFPIFRTQCTASSRLPSPSYPPSRGQDLQFTTLTCRPLPVEIH